MFDILEYFKKKKNQRRKRFSLIEFGKKKDQNFYQQDAGYNDESSMMFF